MIAISLGSAEFVGRREELGLLHDEFARVCERQARFVVVEGEAGIGKSRLLHEFLASLKGRATTLRGHCSEQLRVPYRPLATILPRLEAGGMEKARFFEAAARALGREGARRPLVVAIEDLQWADSATIELLTYLVANFDVGRVMLAVTLRTDGVVADPALAAFRHQAARNRARFLRLSGLRASEIRHIVTQSLRANGAAADLQTLSKIESLAEGNPLFAEELAHVAVESPTLDLSASAPLSLQATLSERLSPLPADDRATLVRAAILGQRFDANFLAGILDRDPATVLETMQRAVAAGIVVASREPPDEFVFRHAMIRQALADQLILGLAAPLHVRIAEALARLPDADARSAELAYHWSAARDAERARFYNERAAEAAESMNAYRDAIGFYTAALRWDYPPGPQRAAVYEHVGTLLYIEGIGDEPAAWFERCRAEYERFGAGEGSAHALLRLADQHWVDARTNASLEAATVAASLLDARTSPALAAQAALSLARFSITLGDCGAAQRHLNDVAGFAERFGLDLEAEIYEVRAETRAALGDADGALDDCASASRLAQRMGVSETIAQIENNYAMVAYDLGCLDVAIERHTIAIAEARRTAMLWRVAYCALNFANTLLLRGELDTARTLVWEALDSGVTTATLRTKAAAVGIPLALRLDDRALLVKCADEETLQFARRSGEIQRIASVYAAFAELRFAQGARDEGLRLLDAALDAVDHPHRAWSFFVQVGLAGSSEQRERALRLTAGATARPRLVRAHRLLLSGRLEGAARAFRRLGFAVPIAETAPAQETPALSARQSEIATLVAQGQSNRSIAARLHISEHTVEHHLSNIFARLGLRSRTELAARVAAGISPARQ
ncbi:MAG TPA: AAA family ATPase [Candidatus Acidoferrales bacterium]|nr:AAA family ATPase [Candidatus Acidoferrales bacterium]